MEIRSLSDLKHKCWVILKYPRVQHKTLSALQLFHYQLYTTCDSQKKSVNYSIMHKQKHQLFSEYIRGILSRRFFSPTFSALHFLGQTYSDQSEWDCDRWRSFTLFGEQTKLYAEILQEFGKRINFIFRYRFLLESFIKFYHSTYNC